MSLKNKFIKKTKGSITVFVTLIFVPSIFFVAFMVDLARVKLVGTQAAMAADNYGEAVLTVYDNELKDRYGLFAISQDGEAIGKLEAYVEYLKSSFNPNSNTITFEHLVNMGFGSTEYSGMMPYRDAEVVLEYEKVESSKLSEEEIFYTQIGDFMKFRIFQVLGSDERVDQILEALEKVQETKGTSKAIGKQQELNKEIGKLYDAAWHFYYYAKLFKNLSGRDYMSYIDDINTALETNTSAIEEIAASGSYQIYYAYKQEDEGAMKAAAEKRDRIEARKKESDGKENDNKESGNDSEEAEEELDGEEERLLAIYDAYVDDENAHEDTLRENFTGCILAIQTAVDNGPKQTFTFQENDSIDEQITLALYDRCAIKFKDASDKVSASAKKIATLREQLETILQTEKVDDDVKENMEKDLELLDEIDQPEVYVQMAQYAYENEGLNSRFKTDTEEYIEHLKQVVESYMNCAGTGVGEHLQLDMSTYQDFYKQAATKTLYDNLEEMFANESDGANETKAKKKQAEEFVDKYNNEELDKETTTARDLPAWFLGNGNKENGKFKFDLDDMSWITNLFSMNGIINELNRFLLKFYLVEYDFGMFSSRVTDKKVEAGEEIKSLTGYAMNNNLNYLYGAEIEYIFGGYKSSKSNLDKARNTILAFRSVMNFASTYRIQEINNTISAFQAPPLTALLVRAALRSGVTLAETYADWEQLKEDKSVVLTKKNLTDMTAISEFAGLLGKQDEWGKIAGTEEKFSMDYEQYLTVLLAFVVSPSDLASRTQDLIELNVNTAKTSAEDVSKAKPSSAFEMGKAYTAVDATCSVHINFVVIPEGYMRKVVPDEEESMREYEKRRYKFTVTRGY
ncbi:MAG: DUF5702 domain-containing protein [Alistipes sp.]|nr:DUF5702 domain-containing protein [Alistipes sp.]